MGFLQFGYIFCLLIFALSLSRCEKKIPVGDRTVYIKKTNSKFFVYKNGKPFFIKGAAGFTRLRTLKDIGGNTIRVWDTAGLKAILDSADYYQFSVIVGLPMPPSESMTEFYDNDIKTKAHIQKIAHIVSEFKNRRSLLFWCIGNELVFPHKPKYLKFYKTFNDVVSLIHTRDPNHPVTTTLLSVQPKNIININLRTEIDFLSFNLFGGLSTFSKDIEKLTWFWKGPYLITEWGIEGPWNAETQNSWGSYIENTSTKKAEQYMEIYNKYMPFEDPRFLGSLAFYWGQKQEYTPTWFSLFDEKGFKTEAVNALQYIWTGKKNTASGPMLKYMLLNDKGAKDNIFLTPNEFAKGKILLAQEDSAGLTYKWEILKEDWHKPNGIFSQKRPTRLSGLFVEDKGKEVKFKVPEKEGPYRLFVYVYDQQDFVATANTPFYVLNKP